MAQFSFDIVSDFDKAEMINVYDQTQRELVNRYDFKGANAKVEIADSLITVDAQSDFQVKQIQPILYQKMAGRGIDVACLEARDISPVGQRAKQTFLLKAGIDKELAKKIQKIIKDSQLKVQGSIQGEQIRVTGKKRDDLQSVISLLKAAALELPLQYKNFRD